MRDLIQLQRSNAERKLYKLIVKVDIIIYEMISNKNNILILVSNDIILILKNHQVNFYKIKEILLLIRIN